MCVIDGCDRHAVARGMCHMHYKRWYRKNQDAIYNWRKPLEERFWGHVHKTDTCWLWTGHIVLGYGRLLIGSRTDKSRRAIPAHRFAYELLIGPIPEGAELDHLCRNRCCVNPSHLEPVTRKENILRGNGITAQNARKTHCPKGHPYDEANTILITNGGRKCRACRDERYKQWKRKSQDPLSDISEQSGD